MQTRSELAKYADALLLKAREYASTNHAMIIFPGEEGGYGRNVDGLEGFARTFLLAGFRLVGEKGDDPHGYAQWYAQGIAAGVDPESPDRWVRPSEHDQSKVEAASIALILDMTRPWIWDKFDEETKQKVIEYFAPIVGDNGYPKNNWLWFRVVVETFLRSVGGPYSLDDIRNDLDAHHSYVRKNGWYSDGSARAYDHYVGWAMHLYPVLWSRMQGATELIDPSRAAMYTDMLTRYLKDVVHLVGGNGSPLIQGRSLIYRYACAAPLWAGAIAGVDVPMGLLQTCAMALVSHFKPATDDILTLGWHHFWPRMAQSYSGPSSPYWAVKGLLGLALPADHPVWAAPPVQLPVATGDFLTTIESPGWIVSSTSVDGIVRVINHGTDCGEEKVTSADSPLYARFGYSTHTAPLLADDAWWDPIDQTVCLISEAGNATHRSGMTVLLLRQDGEVGLGASAGAIQWLSGLQTQVGHGQGLKGRTENAGEMTVISLVRGAHEIRLVQVQKLKEQVRALRFGGWPLATNDEATQRIEFTSAHVATDSLVSVVSVVDESSSPRSGVAMSRGDSMLAFTSFVPWVEVQPKENGWHVAQISLTGDMGAEVSRASVQVTEQGPGIRIDVTWPDLASTRHHLILEGD